MLQSTYNILNGLGKLNDLLPINRGSLTKDLFKTSSNELTGEHDRKQARTHITIRYRKEKDMSFWAPLKSTVGSISEVVVHHRSSLASLAGWLFLGSLGLQLKSLRRDLQTWTETTGIERRRLERELLAAMQEPKPLDKTSASTKTTTRTTLVEDSRMDDSKKLVIV